MRRRPAAAADPFAVPPALWPRFLLMAVSVVAAAADLAALLAETVPPSPLMTSSRCTAMLLTAVRGPEANSKLAELMAYHDECFIPPNPLPVPPELAVLLVVGTGCLLAYWLTPYAIVLRRGLVRIDRMPELGPELADLARTAGIRVRFLGDPLNPGVGGLAFGHVGGRRVVLNRGLMALALTDRPAFRAIVLHELAHVRGGDLDVSYLTVTLWRVFVGVLLLPLLVLFHRQIDGVDRSPLGGAGFWGQLIALAVVVLLNHNAVLRERELFADVRAAHWNGGGKPLRAVLVAAGAARDRTGPGTPARRRRWWRPRVRGLFAFHPPPASRLRAIADPAVALAPSVWQCFAVGLTIGLTWAPVLKKVSLGLAHLGVPPSMRSYPLEAMTSLPVTAVPAGAVVALAVWRTLLAGYGPRPLARSQLFGVAAGAGMTAAGLLTDQDAFLGPGIFGLGLPTRAVWWGLLTLLSWACVLWMSLAALAWRSVPRGSRSTRTVSLLGSSLGATVFGLVLSWAFSLRVDVETLGLPPREFLRQSFHGAAHLLSLFPGRPVTVTLLALLIAFPLAGLASTAVVRVRGRDGVG
ncbi:M48 family metalloprotease [Streptomyces sp. NPDC021356]|uniref:M48 family metalloprotease n=1 Tax=Streptomyces sp. NPDC021356 TaxID=3154900 RepID=UPI0033FA6E59